MEDDSSTGIKTEIDSTTGVKIDSRKTCIQCRRLRQTTVMRNTTMSQEAIAKDIARCLREFKYKLICNVVKVLGVPVALELFYETASIQRDGGMMTNDKEDQRKKDPGGVFLTLVKERATESERQMIFKKEKQAHAQRKARKRKETRKKKTEEGKDGVEKMETDESPVGGVSVGVAQTEVNLVDEFDEMTELDVEFGIELT